MSTATLTREAILAMEEGPETDALVRSRVWGSVIRQYRTAISGDDGRRFVLLDPDVGEMWPCYLPDGMPDNEARDFWEPVPAYSTDIAAAWTVVDHWRNPRKPGGYGELALRCEGEPRDGLWVCNFGTKGKGTATTAPLAICRAALLATLGAEA